MKLLRENIRKIRELRNYTQEYMAERLGMSVSGYGKIERSDSDINLSKITLIAEILNVSRAVLLEFNSDEILRDLNLNNKLDDRGLKSLESAKVAVNNKLDSDDISTLLDIIRSLRDENKILKVKLRKYEPDSDLLQ